MSRKIDLYVLAIAPSRLASGIGDTPERRKSAACMTHPGILCADFETSYRLLIASGCALCKKIDLSVLATAPRRLASGIGATPERRKSAACMTHPGILCADFETLYRLKITLGCAMSR